MSACCESGALLGNNDQKTVNDLSEFGRYFGMAYQLIDYYLDQDGLYKGSFDIFQRIDSYISQAKHILTPYRQSPSSSHLVGMCDFLVKRAAHPSIAVP